jgi:transcriptional regulator with XRE-family HTH domain
MSDCHWSPECGRKLRALRFSAGLSLRDAATKAGLHFTYLSRVENNKFAPPSCDALKRLALVYNCDADILLAMAGRLDPDLVSWLIAHPVEIQLLRAKLKESA